MLTLKEVFIFIFTPLLVYPYWLGINFLQNRFLGDNSLYLWLQFDSKRALLNIIRDDWLSALPASYLFVFAILMPCYFLLKTNNSYSLFNFLLLTLFIALAGCLYFIGYNFYALGITSVCCVFLVFSISLINGLFTWKKNS